MSKTMDEEAHGGDVDTFSESDSLIESQNDSNKGVIQTTAFVSTTLWLLALAGCLAFISVIRTQGAATSFDEIKPVRTVMLFGDSLVGVSDAKYHLGDELAKSLMHTHKEYEVVVETSGVNGNCAKDLLRRVDSDVLDKDDLPDGVVILFDSDAADVESADQEATKKTYRTNLEHLIMKIQSKVEYVSLAGPILKGELKKGKNEKDDILDDYEEINKDVSLKYKIDYIPLRQYFFAEEKHSEKAEEQDEGKLTMDGEHPLRGGAEIIQDHITSSVNGWKKMWRMRESDKQMMQLNSMPYILQPLFGLFHYVGVY